MATVHGVTATQTAFTERPLSPEDASAVTELLAAWERADPADHHYTETDIREEFGAPDAALDGGGVAVLDGERVVAYGLLYVVAQEPEWVAYSDGGVHPDVHRRGVGRRVLDRQVDQARRLWQAQCPDRPGEVRVGVAETRVGAIAALTAAGFTTRRYFLRMRADLIVLGPVERSDPPGIHIRPYRQADDEAVRSVSNAAFSDHWGSTPRDAESWRAQFTEASSFRPGASFVAERDGVIVGFLLAGEHDADTAQRGHRTGYVTRLGTVRSARGQGVGTVLVARALAAMRESGCTEAELDVDADSPTGAGRLYERLGFVVFGRERLLTRQL